MKITVKSLKYIPALLLVITASAESSLKDVSFAKQIFQPLTSFQFILTVKSQENLDVFRALPNFTQYLWELECSLILRKDTNQLLRRLMIVHHLPSMFVQLMLAQESGVTPVHNPLYLLDWNLRQFNKNVGIYHDIFLVFLVQAQGSRRALQLKSDNNCLTP